MTANVTNDAAAGPPADRDLEELLEAFAEAWNRHDVETLVSLMTEDGIFEASAGNAVNGERHEGRHAVRAAYEAVFDTVSGCPLG